MSSAKRPRIENSDAGSSNTKSRSSQQPDSEWRTKTAANSSKPSVLIYSHPDLTHGTQIIAFDLDSTIIKTKSNKKFAQDKNDWVWQFPSVPRKIQLAQENGAKIVIFSNQGGVATGKTPENDIRFKVQKVIEKLGVPAQAFIACEKDQNRKPSPDMWQLMASEMNGGCEVDLTLCKYVGDAAGRPDGWAPGKKKDFSCSDRQFALNIGIKFQTPEEFFLDSKPFILPPLLVDPQALIDACTNATEEKHAIKTQELIILVGLPGSGKSSFAKRQFVGNGYVHVNRDTLKTMDKCVQACKDALSGGKSAVVDNTNPTRAARKTFIDLAKAKGVPVRCFHMDSGLHLALHLNKYRERHFGKEHIPMMVYHKFKKDFEAPTVAEGITSIHAVSFFPVFETDDHKRNFLLQYDLS